MNKILVGVVSCAILFPLISFAKDGGKTSTVDSHSNVERSVAPLPPKPPMGTGAMMVGSGTMNQDMPRSPMDTSDAMTGTGTMNQDMPRPPKPPMGTGAMMSSGDLMDLDMRDLSTAIKQLSPTDHEALVKMIKEYLASKSITLPTNDITEKKGWNGTIKGNIINTDTAAPRAIFDTTKTKRDALKAKRNALKAKIKGL